MPGPLGIRDAIDLSPDQEKILLYIEDFDLDEELRAAVANGDLEEHERETAELELKRFFALAYLPVPSDVDAGGVLAPSGRLDAVWHQFIVNTPVYHRFCDRVYGRYLHHNPAEDGAEGRNNALERMEHYFEDWDEEMWSGAFLCYVFDFDDSETTE